MLHRRRLYLLLIALGCATARANPEPDLEATITRGGGLSGIFSTVHLWHRGSRSGAEWQRSDVRRWRSVHVPSDSLETILVDLDSLARVPPVVPDTGGETVLCGDTNMTRLEVRHGQFVRVAQQHCSRFSAALDAYWTRLNGILERLETAAQ